VICPKYFPVAEGLGHYTTEFCRHLARLVDVGIWTSRDRGPVTRASGHPPPAAITVFDSVRRWTLGGPFASASSALAFDPDRILVQFVPNMYAPKSGINFGLVLLAWHLARRAKARGKGHVSVMFHELWYPFGWQPKALVLHLSHRAMVLGVALASKDIFCSTARNASEVRRLLGPLSRPIHVLPVGSSLERDQRPERAARRDDGRLKLAIFGSLHLSKNTELVLETIRQASRESPWKIELTIVGPTLDELHRAMPDLAPWLAEEVNVAGQLEADEAADCLAAQDFLVAYFQDGVSTRRTTLMAALCEGTPVVTTWRDVSDAVFRDRPFITLLSCDEDAFRREFVALMRSRERPFSSVSRDEVRAFYREHFSWDSVVQRFTELSGIRATGGGPKHADSRADESTVLAERPTGSGTRR
jgi:glycosyltransferase involved in cell wall biosynthesis